MRRWSLSAVLFGALLVPAASAGGSAHGCFPQGSNGVVRASGARIFSMPADNYHYYGCLLRTGKPVGLFDEGTDPRRPFRLAGHYVVYSSQADPVGGEDASYVSITDLRSTNSLPASYDAGPYRARLTRLLVTPDAS